MTFLHCRHYNGRDLLTGKSNGKCRAGVDPVYSFCGGVRFGFLKKAPCLQGNGSDIICPAADFPTKEEALAEAKAFEAEMDAFISNLQIVRPTIVKAQKESGEWAGKVECPKCAKPLHWRMAQSNQHIHARCETEGCVSWME